MQGCPPPAAGATFAILHAIRRGRSLRPLWRRGRGRRMGDSGGKLGWIAIRLDDGAATGVQASPRHLLDGGRGRIVARHLPRGDIRLRRRTHLGKCRSRLHRTPGLRTLLDAGQRPALVPDSADRTGVPRQRQVPVLDLLRPKAVPGSAVAASSSRALRGCVGRECLRHGRRQGRQRVQRPGSRGRDEVLGRRDPRRRQVRRSLQRSWRDHRDRRGPGHLCPAPNRPLPQGQIDGHRSSGRRRYGALLGLEPGALRDLASDHGSRLPRRRGRGTDRRLGLGRRWKLVDGNCALTGAYDRRITKYGARVKLESARQIGNDRAWDRAPGTGKRSICSGDGRDWRAVPAVEPTTSSRGTF
jgi:hypothetical protein